MALLKDLPQKFSKPIDFVLDAFIGACSMVIACFFAEGTLYIYEPRFERWEGIAEVSAGVSRHVKSGRLKPSLDMYEASLGLPSAQTF